MKNEYKNVITIVLIACIVFGWGLSLTLAFPEHVKPIMMFAILLPVIPTSIVLWILSRSVPQNILKKIHEISIRVEKDLERERIALDTTDIPEEVLSFVNVINRLLSYHHDRYQQERDFTAHASHELRTPLAGIRLQTELAMATNDPVKQKNALKNVMKSIDRSTRLVEQLLTISRLTNENVDLVKEQVDLVSLLGRTVKDNMDAAKKKNISLSFSSNNESIFVDASEDSLNILVDNLIRNALTYTPNDGKVNVNVTTDMESMHAILTIEDTGPGIPVYLRDRVMKRFEKGDKGVKTGTGLGLAIVKRIVDLHGGQINLQDVEHGEGLRVLVTLPVRHHKSRIQEMNMAEQLQKESFEIDEW